MEERLYLLIALVGGLWLNIVKAAPAGKNLVFNRLGNADTKDSNLETFLQESVQNFIYSMGTGIPDLKIPPFDPWVANSSSFPFRIVDNSISLRADADAQNVTSVGLSSVQIFEESVNGDIYSIYLNVSDLTIEGIYSVTGSHHIVYPILGGGGFSVTAFGVFSTGTTQLVYADNNYSFREMNLLPLRYVSASSFYENLSIAGTATNPGITASVISQLTDELWNQVEGELSEQFSVALIEYLNQQLLGRPARVLIAEKVVSSYQLT